MSRFRNSLSVEYKKQKRVINEFDEALKKEENIEKELKETKKTLEKIELNLKAAITERKKIQEKMRISAIKTAHGLRDPGNIIFLSLSCLNLTFREARRQSLRVQHLPGRVQQRRAKGKRSAVRSSLLLQVLD